MVHSAILLKFEIRTSIMKPDRTHFIYYKLKLCMVETLCSRTLRSCPDNLYNNSKNLNNCLDSNNLNSCLDSLSLNSCLDSLRSLRREENKIVIKCL